MGLFDKKYCEFCGEKLGLFGKTTLKDGYMCSSCARKLSTWWGVGKTTTVLDIREHMMYREDNAPKVAEFRVTKSFGEDCKVLVDEDARRVMFTSASDLIKANPDVFEYSDITSASYRIDESRSEITTKDKDNKTISYDPKRYEYRYNFYVTVYVKNPYFSTITFKINSSYVYINPWSETEDDMMAAQDANTGVEEANKRVEEARAAVKMAEAQLTRRPAPGHPGMPVQTSDTLRQGMNQAAYDFASKELEAALAALETAKAAASFCAVDRYTPNTAQNEDYQNYKAVAEEIVAFLNATK